MKRCASGFHAYASSSRPVAGFFETTNVDEASNRIPPTSHCRLSGPRRQRHGDTDVREKNVPPEKATLGKTSFQSTKSGSGEQSLPLDCGPRARIKAASFHGHRHEDRDARLPPESSPGAPAWPWRASWIRLSAALPTNPAAHAFRIILFGRWSRDPSWPCRSAGTRARGAADESPELPVGRGAISRPILCSLAFSALRRWGFGAFKALTPWVLGVPLL